MSERKWFSRGVMECRENLCCRECKRTIPAGEEFYTELVADGTSGKDYVACKQCYLKSVLRKNVDKLIDGIVDEAAKQAKPKTEPEKQCECESCRAARATGSPLKEVFPGAYVMELTPDNIDTLHDLLKTL